MRFLTYVREGQFLKTNKRAPVLSNGVELFKYLAKESLRIHGLLSDSRCIKPRHFKIAEVKYSFRDPQARKT